MNEATRNYARQHADDDVRMLALRGSVPPDVDLQRALQQIQGRQQARRKLPSWAAIDAIVYPPHLNMEQCSSEATARYKAALCRRLLAAAAVAPSPSALLDLTGGFGVDFAFMATAFDEATYVELNPQLFAISSQNFAVLGLRATTVNADATAHLAALADPVTLIYLDPARRDAHGARTYGIADCTPDVLALLPELLRKSDNVLLKLSPMLDWRKAVADLGPEHVAEVHIVSVHNECKELLLVLRPHADETALFCINDADSFVLTLMGSEASADPVASSVTPAPGLFLYEPNASIMKAGCFDALAARYAVGPVSRDSHLFLAPRRIADFPGRTFRITAVTSLNKRDLRQSLRDLDRANITTRNFPLSVADLRARLKLADGGDTYIFATTTVSAERLLLICAKS